MDGTAFSEDLQNKKRNAKEKLYSPQK